MSNRKIINAAATGGIGYYPVVGTSDPYYDKVSLLLNGDTNVDTNFADVSLLLTGNDLLDKSNNKLTVTVNGNAVVSTANKKIGTGSYYFDGTGDYLSVSPITNFIVGTGDFTVECWFYQTSKVQPYPAIFNVNGSWAANVWNIQVNDNDNLSRVCFSGANVGQLYTTSTVTTGVWYHVAVTRASGTMRIFLNGVLDNSASVAGSIDGGSVSQVNVGSSSDTAHQFNGFIDDFRFTKGVARYTANFTPPTQALPSHEILDSSVYSLPVTAYGNARIDTATKKYGTGSMYFDGTGDYLTLLPNINLAFPADFTIELWFNSSSFAAQRTLISTAGYYVAGNNGNWTFRVSNASSIAFAQYNSQSAAGGGWEFPVPAMSTGTWYHVAVARSNGTISLYLNGTASSTTYSNSSNISDGSVSNVYIGHNASYDNDWIGYVDDLRITKGLARYTANFTPPTTALPAIPPTISADPWWGNVSLLLDGNTTDAYDPYWQNVSLMLTGDDFIDWSNQHNAITVAGNTSINTVTKKYGTGAMYFDGSGDYLNLTYSKTNFDWWTSDFTLECWVNPTTLSSFDFYSSTYNLHVSNLIGNASASSAYANWLFGPIGDGRVTFYYYNGSVVTPTNSTATISAGVWSHIALTKTSSGFQIWVNGVGNGYTAISGTPQAGTDAPFIVGNCQGYCVNGYVDDLRITKGVARYTANFTPPTAALPSYKIQDRTQNNLTLTPYGNVQLSTDVKKNGTGSMYFDGTGDYIAITPTTNLVLGTSDFTIEGWFYQIAGGTYAHIFTTTASYLTANQLRMTNQSGTTLAVFSGGSTTILTASTSYTQNTWNHFALVRSGNTMTLYLNGVSVGSNTSVSTSFVADASWYVGSDSLYNYSWNGYIDDFRVTKGYARYTQNFTPPSQSFATQYISTGFDPNYADVSLLLTGEGTNGSTTFTDLSSSPKTITAYGDTKISTAVKKYGTGAMYFSGTRPCRLKSDAYASLAFGTGDFTIELWCYQVSKASGYPRLINFNADYTTNTHALMMNTDDAVNKFRYAVPGNMGDAIMVSTTTLASNTWYHVAVTRSGTTFRLFVNGTQESTYTSSATVDSNAAAYITLGDTPTMTASEQFNGYIDDLRITKGIARYTTSFTPPTYALATTTGTPFDVNRVDTSLLLRGNGTNGSTSFTDESPNNLTVTNTGSVTVNTSVKKYGTGSMAFSGSNYLSTPSNTAFNFGTGDFTIEAWIYLNAYNTGWGSQIAGAHTYIVGCDILFAVRQTGNLYMQIGNSPTGAITSTSTVSLSTWTHVTVVRNSGVVTYYINGTAAGTTTYNTSVASTYPFQIGCDSSGNAAAAFNGYIDDLRITKGYARYSQNFTPPTYEDPIVTGTQYDYNYAQVSLLLNGDGTNGSQVFTDLSSSPKTITAGGNAQISTGTKKFGTGALSFTGSSFLTIPSNPSLKLGNSDFTIELWYYANDTNIFTLLDDWSTASTHSFFLGNSGNLVFLFSLDGNSYTQVGTGAVITSVWNHLAVVRYNNQISVYKNGTISGTSVSISSSIYVSQNPLWVGTNAEAPSGWAFNGYIDDLRITKGLARYTQNFTPPTAPLPTSGGY